MSENNDKQVKEVIVQTIRKEYNTEINTGIAYYTFITAINNIKLSRRLLELLAFINYRGTISSTSARKDFCDMFNSSEATIGNMVSQLYKLKLLIKEKSKTKINPAIRIDFNKDVIIKMFLNTKTNKEEVSIGD